MRRRIAIALFLLLLGAVANVAVAWACSWLAVPQYVETAVLQRGEWPERLVPDYAQQPVYPGAHWRSFGIEETEILFTNPIDFDAPGSIWLRERSVPTAQEWSANLAEHLDQLYLEYPGVVSRQLLHENSAVFSVQVRAGWPKRTLTGWLPGALPAYPPSKMTFKHLPEGRVIVVMHPVDSDYLVRGLPYQPMWSGFVVNTIFYAIVLWLMFAMPRALRRRLRIRRGQCPACAYPIGTSPVCTECGAAVSVQ